ncbi:hypothetical protein ROA7450_03100 [Roseovarius albus]|uniref:LysM domain-containing protein n=1 Tax=Roseovarius albus TaxID=1247867 RepID=A0A1X6ZSC9_9RHOB|nr:hypothetical protein [Roseovarius albus]SLN59788.1 hypothetical protein ROA7450_03100 [Roseovarius albus]
MFNKFSRYHNLPIKSLTDAAGREVAYVARRIIPQGKVPIAQVKVQPGDRLDLVAHRSIGAADQFWRVGDANPTPNELPSLTAMTGRRLNLTLIDPE